MPAPCGSRQPLERAAINNPRPSRQFLQQTYAGSVMFASLARRDNWQRCPGRLPVHTFALCARTANSEAHNLSEMLTCAMHDSSPRICGCIATTTRLSLEAHEHARSPAHSDGSGCLTDVRACRYSSLTSQQDLTMYISTASSGD